MKTRFHVLACLFVLAPSIGHAEDVALDRWLRHVRVSLPVGLCAPGAALRVCFPATAQQCELGIASAARSCIDDMKADLPTVVQLPDQGKALGGQIGECTANAYAAAFRPKFTPSNACTAALKEAQRMDRLAR